MLWIVLACSWLKLEPMRATQFGKPFCVSHQTEANPSTMIRFVGFEILCALYTTRLFRNSYVLPWSTRVPGKRYLGFSFEIALSSTSLPAYATRCPSQS